MNTPPNPRPDAGDMPLEFPTLVEKKLTGTLSPEEQARMENHLRESLAAMDYYISLSMVEGLLPAALTRAATAGKIRPARRSWKPWAAGIAASLALAGSAFWLWHSGQSTHETQVAGAGKDGAIPCRLYNAIGVVWESPSTLPGTRLATGKVAITSGVVELALDSGVHLLMEGPASLEITGRNAGRLAYGKVVADVPDGAQGFTLDSPVDKVIDHGTRFAMQVGRADGKTTLGVLSGVVDLQTKDETVRLYTDYAVEHGQDGVVSIPFERDHFVTQLPSAEIPWDLDGMPFKTPRTLRVTLPPIMGIPGDLQIIFKRLTGFHTIDLRHVTLLHNGQPVARAPGAKRRLGLPHNTQNNIVTMAVPADAAADGLWELEMEMSCDDTPHFPPPNSPPPSGPPTSMPNGSINANGNALLSTLAQGVMLVNKGVFKAEPADFVGRWEYSHNGHVYVREFLPDGRFALYGDGKVLTRPDDGHWSVSENILTVVGGKKAKWETHMLQNRNTTHMLRDRNTLVFLNTPYRNARRMADPGISGEKH